MPPAERASAAPGAKPGWQRGVAIKAVGGTILLACLYFLAERVSSLDWGALWAALTPASWLAAALCALGYAGLLSLLASAWCGQAAEGRRIALSEAVALYGKAVLAKYLPGSVFQYASRQWLGARAGMAQRTMARASLVEIILHIAFAAAIGGALLIGETPLAYLAVLGGAAAIAAVAVRGGAGAGQAIVRQGLFFLGFAGLVWIMAIALDAPMGAGRLTGWFMVAWLAGFLVPLAPGGVGVREAALLALGGPSNTAPVLAAALVLRLITLAGDAVFGLAAYGLGRAER